MIHVKVLKPTAQTLRPFINLPWQIYKNDKNWVPPIRRELRRQLLRPDNELFSRGVHRFFVCYEDNKPMARVLAGIDLDRNRAEDEPTGYFALFDSFDNFDCARAVLDAASAFLRDHGIKRVIGPVPLSADALTRGVLVQGFDEPPVLFNAYNKPYYDKLLTDYGFTKERDFFAYTVNIQDILTERILPIADKVQNRFGFTVKYVRFTRRNQKRLARDIAAIIGDATPYEPGQTLPEPEDILRLYKLLRPIYRKELCAIAYEGNRPIGVVMSFLDYNRVIKRFDGRLVSLRSILGLVERRMIDTVRCPMQYVVPEYQNKAVNAVLLAKAVEGAKKLGIKRIEGSTIDENQMPSINNALMTGARPYKTYRQYQKAL